MHIIGVVLNCPDWFDEAARLMDRAFQRYESVTMLNAGESLRTLPVAHSGGASVHAALAADLRGVVMQGAIPSIEIDLGSEELDAPVICGTPLGVARLISGGEVIAEVPLVADAEVPLVADADVPRDDFPAHWRRIWENWLMVENAPVTNGV